MPHPAEHSASSKQLDLDEADELAQTLRALGSPPRLRLLVELLDGERTVDQLAATIELQQSATSHHLRLLRALRLVRVRREGRHAYYALHDHHIGELLAAVRHHHEHVHPSRPLHPPNDKRPKAASKRAPSAS